MKLVFATHNKNKFKEIESLLPKHITLLSLDDIGCTEDIEENATTIEGNALIKAQYVKENYNYDCFADDTGLEIEELGGEPGVYSARYAGEDKSSDANINKVLEKLESKSNRKAQFKTVIALTLNKEEQLFTGICSGEITKNRKGTEGFGYDPIFQPEGYSITFAEMTLSEKSTISHRARAFNQLTEYLAK
ncbi:XTP/dITP diphosphohydrolase [Mesonia phycicola]|uniref:dITP/XTP pyrophosphatase n=1 Tax=Mesonia phycicola TaxID=579105 RepID=A0A1M6DSQ9_9FLAO|nr:non-canonical purine NTP diphosphatase [Mesonia phycicola]SHI76160.1 XTP/dITP diphosphohydrolase [Mesonia phycicola]